MAAPQSTSGGKETDNTNPALTASAKMIEQAAGMIKHVLPVMGDVSNHVIFTV